MTDAKPSNSVQEGKALTRKQKEAIPHLIMARSLQGGCRGAKISKVTLYTWLKEESFKSALEETRESVIAEALERLKAGITGAIDGLLKLSGDRNKSIRLKACEKCLDFFLKIREIDELEDRLETIERVILERRSYR